MFQRQGEWSRRQLWWWENVSGRSCHSSKSKKWQRWQWQWCAGFPKTISCCCLSKDTHSSIQWEIIGNGFQIQSHTPNTSTATAFSERQFQSDATTVVDRQSGNWIVIVSWHGNTVLIEQFIMNIIFHEDAGTVTARLCSLPNTPRQSQKGPLHHSRRGRCQTCHPRTEYICMVWHHRRLVVSRLQMILLHPTSSDAWNRGLPPRHPFWAIWIGKTVFRIASRCFLDYQLQLH